MKVFKILASLKRMLAARALDSMGIVVHDAIRNNFIPRLRAMLDKTPSEEERRKIQDMIALYERYSDPRFPESKIYGESAANIIRKIVSAGYNLGQDTEDEVAQALTAKFYNGRYMNYLTRYNVERLLGPLQLNKLWTTIIFGGAKEIMRNMRRQQPGLFRKERETDEGTQVDPIGLLPARPEDADKLEKLFEEMRDYVRPRLKSKNAVEVFDLWYNVLMDKGDVNFKRDIVPVVRDKLGIGETSVNNYWKEQIQPTIAQFYTRELGLRLSPEQKKKLRFSSVDVLTYEFFRRRIAAWILG